MAWGRMECVGCGHVFDAYTAELQDQRRQLGPVGEPTTHIGDYYYFTGRDPIPHCPECNLAQRMAVWPFVPLICSFALVWLAGMTMLVITFSDKIPDELAAPLPWIVGLCFAGSLVYAIIAHSIAKPIRC